MAELTVTSITKSGLSIASSMVAADAANDTVIASSGLMFVVDNAGASPITVTITPPVSEAACGSFGNLSVDPIAHTIANGVSDFSFTIPTGYSSGGLFTLEYSDVTSVSVGVFSLS